MISEAKYHMTVWLFQMKQMAGNGFSDLSPQEYCIGAVFVISIGYVLLSGRR